MIGGGFLGSAVATKLTQADHDVVVYSRSFSSLLTERREAQGSGRLSLVKGEIAVGEPLETLIDGAELVLYFAGGSTPAGSDADAGESVALSVVPATIVLDSLRRTSTRRIVLASSGGTVYGQPDVYPTDEKQPTRPISIHGHNALTIERNAEFFARRHDLEVVVLRYSNAYGPRQQVRRGQGVIAAWTTALARSEAVVVYGGESTRRDFLYIDDAADATVRAALDAVPGTYNVGSGRSTSLSDLIELLGGATGQPIEAVHRPRRDVDVERTELDSSRLLAEVGWKATTPLADGLRAAWLAARDGAPGEDDAAREGPLDQPLPGIRRTA